MKQFPFLLFALLGCVSKPAETGIAATDSLAVAPDTVSTPVQSGPVATPVVDDNLPESLKNQPMAVYHGYYRLNSSSPAEQARMRIMFEGNRTFSYYIDYGVADFCSAEASGSFTLDEKNIGSDLAAAPADENRSSGLNGQLTFTFGDGMIQVSDGIHTFGVGVCNLSGEFFKCDGPCPEIKSEDYGIEETEGDSVR